MDRDKEDWRNSWFVKFLDLLMQNGIICHVYFWLEIRQQIWIQCIQFHIKWMNDEILITNAQIKTICHICLSTFNTLHAPILPLFCIWSDVCHQIQIQCIYLYITWKNWHSSSLMKVILPILSTFAQNLGVNLRITYILIILTPKRHTLSWFWILAIARGNVSSVTHKWGWKTDINIQCKKSHSKKISPTSIVFFTLNRFVTQYALGAYLLDIIIYVMSMPFMSRQSHHFLIHLSSHLPDRHHSQHPLLPHSFTACSQTPATTDCLHR